MFVLPIYSYIFMGVTVMRNHLARMLHRPAGFTLIELLVVIAIIAVLIALVAARSSGRSRGGPAVPNAATI